MSESKRVFKAFSAIGKRYPKIAQKKRLDLAYHWNEAKTSEKPVDCNEFWDYVSINVLDDLQAEIDFYDHLLEYTSDFITSDVFGKEKKQARTAPARSAKREKSLVQKSAAAKRTKVGQSLGKGAFEVGDPSNFIKIGKELLPMPILNTPSGQVRGRQSFSNRPMTPVSSSNVMGRGVRGNNLYVQFHGSEDKVYKYNMGSSQAAQEAFEEMAMNSPGRYVWNNLRGRTQGPVFGKPRRNTAGGTTSSIKPYDKLTYSRVKKILSETKGYSELATKWGEYKKGVKALGEGATSGEPFKIEEIKKFQENLLKEKLGRKNIHEEIKLMLKEAKEKLKRDELGKEVEESIERTAKGLKTKEVKKQKKRPHFTSAKGMSSSARSKDMETIINYVMDAVDKDKGRWVTMRGTHIFIKKGQDPKEALQQVIGKKTKMSDKERAQKEKKLKGLEAKLKEKNKSKVSSEVAEKREDPPKKPDKKDNDKDEFELPKEEKKEKAKRLTEKEKLIQKKVEKTGLDRERAIEELVKKGKIKGKIPKKKPVKKEKKEPKKDEGKEDRIKRLTDELETLKKKKKSHTTEKLIVALLKEINRKQGSGDNFDMGTLSEDTVSELEHDLVNDSFDDLIAWVIKNIASDPKAAKEIAFRILQKRKSDGKTDRGEAVQWEKNWGHLRKEFEILGLKKENITRSDIKLAFFKTAKKTHPDRKGGTAKKFIEANKAQKKLLGEIGTDLMDDLTFSELGLKRREIPKEGEDKPDIEGYEIPKQEWLEQLKGQLKEALKFKDRYEDKLLSDDPKVVVEANKALNYLNESIESHFKEIQELKRELTTFTSLGLKRKEGVTPEVSKAKEFKFEPSKPAVPIQSKLPKAEREARFQDRTDRALSALKNLRNDEKNLKSGIRQKFPQRAIEKNKERIKEWEVKLNKELSKLYPKDRTKFAKKYELSHGKGRGWHGESERHSEAAKKGARKDMAKENFPKTNEYLETRIWWQRFEINEIIDLIRESYEGNKDAGFLHKKYINKEDVYIRDALIEVKLGNLFDLDRFELSERELAEIDIPKFQKKENNISQEIKTLKKEIENIKNTFEPSKSEGLMTLRKKRIDRDVQIIERKIEPLERKKKGLLNKIEKLKNIGKGRGWHGEPERHSTAAKKGKHGDNYLIKKDYVDILINKGKNAKIGLDLVFQSLPKVRGVKTIYDSWFGEIEKHREAALKGKNKLKVGEIVYVYGAGGSRYKGKIKAPHEYQRLGEKGHWDEEKDAYVKGYDDPAAPNKTYIVEYVDEHGSYGQANYEKDKIHKGIPPRAGFESKSKLKDEAKQWASVDLIPKNEEGKGKTRESDFVPFSPITNDSTELGGYIARDGPMLYGSEIKYKEWDNLKEIYGNTSHMISYGSRKKDSHTERDDYMIGFFDTFELVPKGEKGPYPVKDKHGNLSYIDENYNRVATKLHLHEDILELTDLKEDQVFELPVSASYDDIGHGNVQNISKLHHGAVSLNKNEMDRCSTLNGSACNMSVIADFMEESSEYIEGRVEGDHPEYDIANPSENQNLPKIVIPI